jgi:hypothetical protein
MGKRRWRRVRVADLADRETQRRVLEQLETVQGQDTAPEQESPAERGAEAAQGGRSRRRQG